MTAVSRRGVRGVLVSALVLCAMLLGITAMHASMVKRHSTAQAGSAMSVEAMASSGHAHVTSEPMSVPGMGGMDLADCLLLGMICFLTTVAVVVLAMLLGRLRTLLQARAPADLPAPHLSLARPPRRPSLLALSICRT